jgi:hypothetical protein
MLYLSLNASQSASMSAVFLHARRPQNTWIKWELTANSRSAIVVQENKKQGKTKP